MTMVFAVVYRKPIHPVRLLRDKLTQMRQHASKYRQRARRLAIELAQSRAAHALQVFKGLI